MLKMVEILNRKNEKLSPPRILDRIFDRQKSDLADEHEQIYNHYNSNNLDSL